MTRTLLSLAVFSLFANFFPPPIIINNQRAASHVPLAQLKLSLVPPANYDALPDDAGFFRRGSSPENGDEQIRVSKYLVDWNQIKESIRNNSTGAAIEDLTINNYNGLWIEKTDNAGGHTLTTLTMAFGNSSYSYMLVGLFPGTDATTKNRLLRAIQSAYVDTFGYSSLQVGSEEVRQRNARANTRLMTAFSKTFKIDVTASGFRGAEATDDNIIYTLDGAFPPVSSDKSYIQVRKISSIVSESSYQNYSLQILSTYADFHEISNAVPASISIDGLNGIQVTADAKNDQEQPARVYQLTLFESDKVYIMTGLSYLNSEDRINTFKTIALTFSRTPQK